MYTVREYTQKCELLEGSNELQERIASGCLGLFSEKIAIIQIATGGCHRALPETYPSHVGKYDRADDRPKLAMLAANVGYQYWTDDRSRLG